MAKERRIGVQPEVGKGAENLAKKLFAGDVPRVVDLSMLVQQLELDGVQKDLRRPIATEVTGRIRRGELNGIFGPGSKFDLVMTDIIDDDGRRVEVYHRNDAGREGDLRKKYQADKLHFQQEIEERRATPKKQNNRREVVKPVEQVRTQVYLVVLGYHHGENPLAFEQRIGRLVGSLEDRRQQEVIRSSVRQERFADPTETMPDKSRLLLPEDIQRILRDGLTREALQSLFPVLRQKIITNAEFLEEEMLQAATQANEFALEQLDGSEQAVFVAIPAKRVVVPALVRSLVAALQDDRIRIDYHLGDQDYYYSHPSYSYHVLELWHKRSNGESALAILPDEVLLRAIWQEVIGAVYPTPYVLRGENIEAGLVFLRLASDQFGDEEIYNLLSGNEADAGAYALAVGQLEKQIAHTEMALGRLNKRGGNYRQVRSVLDRERAIAQRSLAELQRPKSIKERIEREAEERLLHYAPNKKDYVKGDQAEGYKRALQRYERYKGRIPGLVVPNPQDYIKGESSDGFGNDMAFYQSLYTITANFWQALKRDIIMGAAGRIGGKESILQESIF